MQFNMQSPIVTDLIVHERPLLDENSKFVLQCAFSISHVPQQSYPTFKSVHKLEISWDFSVKNGLGVEMLQSKVKQGCVLLYKHDNEVYEKFCNMLRASHYWSSMEFQLANQVTPLSWVQYPQHTLDEKEIKETTNLLLESDRP